MCFRAFYTSIYNIEMGSKTGREEARTKHVTRTGSPRRGGLPRRSIPLPKRSRQGSEIGLDFA